MDGEMDMTELIVAFSQLCEKAPKKPDMDTISKEFNPVRIYFR